MFSTIMLAPALFETIPKRKHKHITRIVLDTRENTITVETREHITLTFNGNYINDDNVLRKIVKEVNKKLLDR